MYIIAKLTPQGTLVASTNPAIHPNILKATEEVMRLANKEPNHDFIIFKGQSAHRGVNKVISAKIAPESEK